MSIPRFTIRRILLLTTLAAMVAWVANMSRADYVWAQALTFVLMMVGVSFVGFALMFTLATAISNLARVIRPQAGSGTQEDGAAYRSPFAEHRPPPQWLQPEDPV